MKNEIAILSVGEVLIDFIGNQLNQNVAHTREYSRYLGGSPTNVAVNMAKLGQKAVLVSTCGNDGLGNFIQEELQQAKVETSQIRLLEGVPTSIILVSRSQQTPDFIAYREADIHIIPEQIPTKLLQRSKIFHTTCFALSKQPTRDTIMQKAAKAHELGLTLSIDINFSEMIWEHRATALEVIMTYCSYNPLIKISEDDVHRLFKEKLNQDEVFDFFHKAGADVICLTKGSQGVSLSHNYKQLFYPAKEITEIKDTTGAGDAFWSGFLLAYLKNSGWKDCLKSGLTVAAIKLQHIGGLPENITKTLF